MAVRYYKLFDLLNRKNMKKSDLRNVISSATVAKLSKGEYISGEAINKICLFLDCQPNDIMEIYREEKTNDTYNFKKNIYIPNGDKKYTEIQRKLFETMTGEGIITEEQINSWLKDEIFKKSYQFKW